MVFIRFAVYVLVNNITWVVPLIVVYGRNKNMVQPVYYNYSLDTHTAKQIKTMYYFLNNMRTTYLLRAGIVRVDRELFNQIIIQYSMTSARPREQNSGYKFAGGTTNFK